MSRHLPDDRDAFALEKLVAAATAYRGAFMGGDQESALKALIAAAMQMPEPEHLLRCPAGGNLPAGTAPVDWFAVLGSDGLHHPLHPREWGWACSCALSPKPWRGRDVPRHGYGCAGPAVPSQTVPFSQRCTPGHWYWPIHLQVPDTYAGKPIPETWTRSDRPPAWWVRIQVWNRQNGMCAVCREAPGQVLDHDHDTGLVRGLLCKSCNRREGQCAGGEILCSPDRTLPCFPEYWQDPPAAWLNWTHERHSTTLARMLQDVCGLRCPATGGAPSAQRGSRVPNPDRPARLARPAPSSPEPGATVGPH